MSRPPQSPSPPPGRGDADTTRSGLDKFFRSPHGILAALHVVGALAGLAAFGRSGCGLDSPPPRSDADARMELSGCAAVLAGRRCEITRETKTIRVWLDGTWGSFEASSGALRVAVSADPAPPGTRLTVDVPTGGGLVPMQIKVIARAPGRAAVATIELLAASLDPAIAEAQGLRRAGKLGEARARLPETASLPSDQRGRALGTAARISLSEGRPADAVRDLARSVGLNRGAGRVSDAGLDAFAAAFTLMTSLRKLPEARATLDEVTPSLADWDEGLAHVAYYRALLASATGDVGGALAAFGDSERRAERLGMAQLLVDIREMRAMLLVEHGRHAEAARLFAEVRETLPRDAPDCRRAGVLVNSAWTELLASASDERAPAPEARAWLAQARDLFSGPCARPAEVQNIEVNLAMDALARGALDEARAHAEAARAAKVEGARPEVALWLLDVEARVALARGDRKGALAAYDRLLAEATRGDLPHVAWRALTGRGAALSALGRDDDAAAALGAAESLLEQASLRVPVQEGRAAFLGDRSRSARLLSDLLVRRGRPAEALAVLRASRARALSAAQRTGRIEALSPEARARYEAALSRYLASRERRDKLAASQWELAADALPASADALRAEEREAAASLEEALSALSERARPPRFEPPAEGELLVLLDERATALRAFAASGRAVRVVDLPSPPRGSAASAEDPAPSQLWQALSPELESASRVTLSVDGAASSRDWHAALWKGEPLVTRLPVAWSVGLPAPDAPGSAPSKTASLQGASPKDASSQSASSQGASPPGAPPPPSRRALLIADPGNDLQGALAEADAVAPLLAPTFAVERLGGDAASRAAVTAALGRADWLHFAGHGQFDPAAPWTSRLLLAGSDRLSPGDIVSLPAVPRGVVLSGCETGRAPELRHALDVSLAAAFLAAGSDTVIATSRAVADDLARSLAASLYASASSPTWSPTPALAGAQSAAFHHGSAADWFAYRAWVR